MLCNKMFSSKSSTKHINSKKYQYNHVKNKRNHKKAQFLATTQHIQFTKHYFDFESKKIVWKQVQIKQPATNRLKMR